MPGQFGTIRGDSGYISGAGAKVAIIKKWIIVPSRMRPDGTPILQFKAQFSYVNEVLMNLKMNGLPVQKRIRVQMRTERYGLQDVDILGWAEWRFEGGILYLEDIMHTEASNVKFHAVSR